MLKNSLSYFFLSRLILSQRSASLIRKISLLSFLAIVISTSSFFIVLFVMNGMNQNIKNRVLSVDPHLTVFTNNPDKMNINESALLSQIEFTNYDLIIRTIDGQFKGIEALGYSTRGLSFWYNQLLEIKDKKKDTSMQDYLDDGQLALAKNEVAIGIDLARSLGLLEGDIVTLIPVESLLMSSLETPIFEKVTIKKIITTDLYDLDAKLLFYNKEFSLTSFGQSASKNSGHHIWLKAISDIDQVREDIAKQGFTQTQTWNEKNSDLFFALFMEKTMISLLLGLAGLISSSSILTVLALIMTQKKMDIAVIKTLGFSNQKTLKLFMSMGLWISLTAVFMGTAIGLAVSFYLEKYPLNILPQIYYDSTIPALVNMSFVFYVLLAIGLLAVIGCYIPARTALKIQPAILLKNKN